MDQLIERLSRIDYPPDRLQGLLLIEAHDHATLRAAERAQRPPWLLVEIVPPGFPTTKPRALNHGLTRATGDLLTVYDAEDAPHPLQLREAAARFITGSERLACLQAPLRICREDPTRPASAFLDRQFAIEYAALFHVTLPAMAQWGLPFPLGGTSNHFRTEVLRKIGGWDAYNVTEDADLGFRLWRRGYRSGVLTRPTDECPPPSLESWLPQRTRWLKGYMQTIGVHTRTVDGLGWRGLLALVLGLGTCLASAAVHAPAMAWILTTLAVAAVAGVMPMIPAFALLVMATGTLSAWTINLIGARRAGVPYDFRDALLSPLYWSLLSLAFAQASWRLICEPFTWDKTQHLPDAPLGVLTQSVTTFSPAQSRPRKVRTSRAE